MKIGKMAWKCIIVFLIISFVALTPAAFAQEKVVLLPSNKYTPSGNESWSWQGSPPSYVTLSNNRFVTQNLPDNVDRVEATALKSGVPVSFTLIRADVVMSNHDPKAHETTDISVIFPENYNLLSTMYMVGGYQIIRLEVKEGTISEDELNAILIEPYGDYQLSNITKKRSADGKVIILGFNFYKRSFSNNSFSQKETIANITFPKSVKLLQINSLYSNLFSIPHTLQIVAGFAHGWVSNVKDDPTLSVLYVGGENNDGEDLGKNRFKNDGKVEILKQLNDRNIFKDKNYYFLKGYMLEFVAPNAVGGTCNWSVVRKRGANSQNKSFYAGNTWQAYKSPIGEHRLLQVEFWRSDYEDQINDTYQVTVVYQDAATMNLETKTETIKTREIRHDKKEFWEKYNSDVDMLQRMMIQILYLDKGALTYYPVGRYYYWQDGDVVSPGFNLYGFYKSDKPWSPIADEVWNFGKFAMGPGKQSYTLKLNMLQSMWKEFNLTGQADLPNKITVSHDDFKNIWLPGGIAALENMPADIIPTQDNDKEAVMMAVIGKESWKNIHCFKRPAHLAFNSVIITELTSKKDDPEARHTYTNSGLGFGQMQPYNAGEQNIYKPDENILRMAKIMNGHYKNGDNKGNKAFIRLWFAHFAYHQGNFGYIPDSEEPVEPQGLLKNRGAIYADDIFVRFYGYKKREYKDKKKEKEDAHKPSLPTTFDK